MSNNENIKKRLLDPEVVHRIWFGIISLNKNNGQDFNEYANIMANKNDLIEFITNFPRKNDNENNDKNRTKFDENSKLIEKAIEDKLIRLTTNKKNDLTNGNLNDNVCQMIGLPNDRQQRTEHDWYCFECHRLINNQHCSNKLIECQHCWRVYHIACVPNTNDCLKLFDPTVTDVQEQQSKSNDIKIDTNKFTCPMCTLIKRQHEPYLIGSRKLNDKDFNKILSYTYTRFKAKTSHQISESLKKLKQTFSTLTEIDLETILTSKISIVNNETTNGTETTNNNNNNNNTNNNKNKIINNNNNNNNKQLIIHSPKEIMIQLSVYYLVFKPVDLSIIEERLSSLKYTTIGQFFADCLTLKHMIDISICACADQTATVQRRSRDVLLRMVEATRYELKEMIGCVDCYLNSNRQEDKLWFCWPCDPPHTLVFAKQKGYPYWPAKVIYPRNNDEIESSNQLDVRFFGANHERSLIDKANIKHINSSLMELNILKPMPSLDKALLELRTYRDLLERKEKILQKNAANRKDDNDNSKETNNKINNRKKKKLPNKIQTKTKKSMKMKKVKKNNEKLGKKSSKYIESEEDDSEVEDKITIMEKNRIIPEDLMTENESESEMEEDEVKNKDNDNDNVKNEINKDTTDSDTDIDDNDNEVVDNVEMKPAKRGRPLKSEKPSKQKLRKCLFGRRKKKRIRKKKIIYSPTSSGTKDRFKDTSPVPELLKSKRGRKPKEVFSPKIHSSSSQNSINTLIETKVNEENHRPVKKRKLMSPSSSKKGNELSESATSKERSISPQIVRKIPKSSFTKLAYYHKKKLQIEQERQLVKEQRKALMEERKIHIPPVRATKSTPVTTSITLSSTSTPKLPNQSKPNIKPILSNISNNGHNNSVSMVNGIPQTPPPVNGYHYNNNQYQYITTIGGDYLIKTEMLDVDNKTNYEMISATEITNNNNNNNNNAITESTITNNNYQPPSSILKPLNSEGETDEDRTEEECTNNLVPIVKQEDNNNIVQSKNTLLNDDDDEEPYLYDDEQLEDHINFCIEYQNEKAQQQNLIDAISKQNGLNYQSTTLPSTLSSQTPTLIAHQSPYLQAALQSRIANPYNNSNNNNESKTSEKIINGFMPKPGESLPNYIDYSSAKVYAPTKKNQHLVNSYLHHNSQLSPLNGDILANYILKREDFDPEESTVSPKKRGRPPKNSDSASEHTAKARSLLEKSYLQESACNRNCLTNNVKAFKKFREFLEAQSKKELTKIKNELDELNQKVSRLTNKNKELEDKLKREQDLNKRCNPEIVNQLEERYKLQISETKRKQWCALCEAEASYFCCFKTNYCSPECQLKHWQSGHQVECTRNKNSNRINNKLTNTP